MNKHVILALVVILMAALLAGCVGTPVIYYTECDCPDGAHTGAAGTVPSGENEAATPAEGEVSTGLAIICSTEGSADATKADYSVNIVAVTVDANGVIASCAIDSLGAAVEFDAAGVITSDINAELLTKNELGDNYGMVAYGGAKYEWYQQAAALAEFAVGKTVEELRNGAVDESGKAPEGTDLASVATISLGDYVDAIEKAVDNAKPLGAQAGDELKLAVIAGAGSSVSATVEAQGLAQLDLSAAAVTVKDGVITSCMIDSVQAKMNFDTAGVIGTELSKAVATKNELGEAYGMVAWGGAIAEWDQQAAAFAEYVKGKTADEVMGIAVSEGKPADADLAASVTISIGDFQKLIGKALK